MCSVCVFKCVWRLCVSASVYMCVAQVCVCVYSCVYGWRSLLCNEGACTREGRARVDVAVGRATLRGSRICINFVLPAFRLAPRQAPQSLCPLLLLLLLFLGAAVKVKDNARYTFAKFSSVYVCVRSSFKSLIKILFYL